MSAQFHIVYVCDRKYRPYVEVSSASVRVASSISVKVHVIDTDENEIARKLSKFSEYHGSRATFAKFLIPELLPEVDWALYLDGDTLAIGDVCEVFKHCDESKLIVGSRDPESFNLGPDVEAQWIRLKGLSETFLQYFCAGVMLMNLRKMRELKIADACIAFIEKHGTPPLGDQTVLNYVCEGRIGQLPAQWGVFSMCPENVDFTQSAIIHYPQDIPWKRERLNKLVHDFIWLWWKFVELRGDRLDVGGLGGVGFLWRRWGFLLIKCCPWLVTWSPYLRDRLRPLRGLTREERRAILSRWK